jgi:hypothetical protein
MGLRQPSSLSVSPATYGHGEASLADDGGPNPALPLLILVVGLAAAVIWFVAVPTFNRPPTMHRACEVFVLKSGTTKCVSTPAARAQAHVAPKRTKA